MVIIVMVKHIKYPILVDIMQSLSTVVRDARFTTYRILAGTDQLGAISVSLRELAVAADSSTDADGE
jgi:hypothetical protein